MRYINRDIPVFDVAGALDLRLDGATKIHCWHPDRHQHGDRTASVGIRLANNTVKCFVCDFKPMGPIDLVIDVRSLSSPADAALWIAAHFNVPLIPPRRPVPSAITPYQVGLERGLGLLIRSGLWGTLSEAARCIAPVLLEMAGQEASSEQELTLEMSYAAISRYSGVRSHRAICEALSELIGFGFLRRFGGTSQPRGPERRVSRYVVAPSSDDLREAANAFAGQFRSEIAAEKELRKRARQKRIRLLRGAA